MLHDPDSRYQEVQRHIADERRQAASAVHYGHSRSGQLAGFLRALADRIDPTGQARRQVR